MGLCYSYKYPLKPMTVTPPNNSQVTKTTSGLSRDEQADFLRRDFDQAFSEKRRLEDQIWDICKFAFTAHSAFVGLAVGAYSYSLDHELNLIPAATIVLAITFAVGLFLVLLIVRTRVYFVIVSRYINDYRAFFLPDNALGFANSTGFYTDPTKPPYFSWLSTQTWAILLVALLNTGAATALAFLLLRVHPARTTIAIVTFVIIFILQAVAARLYLRAKESSKTSTDAVWGNKK